MPCAEDQLPPRIAMRSARHLWRAGLAGLAVLGTACIIFVFNPQHHSFYPFCLFHHITGLQCPGCGTLRAMHQLLHGNLATAFRFNPLAVIAIPFFAFFMVRNAYRKWTGCTPQASIPVPLIWAGTVVAVLFGILRNIPSLQHHAFPF